MNAIKFLFPDIYMEYNIFNKGNLGIWNQVMKAPANTANTTNVTNINNPTKKEGAQVPPSKTEPVNQNKASETKNEVAERYKKEFIKLRDSLQMDKDEFNKIISKAKYNLKIENPETELDFQRLFVEVNNIISQM